MRRAAVDSEPGRAQSSGARASRSCWLVLAIVLGGCGGDSGPSEPGGATGESRPHHGEALDSPRVSPAPLPPEAGPLVLPPEELRDQVLAHAGELAGVDLAELEVLKSLRVTWRDGSLGCPEPGMNYTMALVPGWHMIIRAGELLLDYRLSDRGFMLCTHPTDNGYLPDPDVTVER